MNEGTRFDLLYDTMPWHKVDAVVFDIGNVLIRYAPDDFLQILFPGDPQKTAPCGLHSQSSSEKSPHDHSGSELFLSRRSYAGFRLPQEAVRK